MNLTLLRSYNDFVLQDHHQAIAKAALDKESHNKKEKEPTDAQNLYNGKDFPYTPQGESLPKDESGAIFKMDEWLMPEFLDQTLVDRLKQMIQEEGELPPFKPWHGPPHALLHLSGKILILVLSCDHFYLLSIKVVYPFILSKHLIIQAFLKVW